MNKKVPVILRQIDDRTNYLMPYLNATMMAIDLSGGRDLWTLYYNNSPYTGYTHKRNLEFLTVKTRSIRQVRKL
jgi:hypothetical protein